MSELRRFTIVDRRDTEQLLFGLSRRHGLVRETTSTSRRERLDSFDWRLHKHGSRLEHRRGRGPAELVWRDAISGEVLGRLEIDAPPRFVWDLPSGAMADRLADVVEMRALGGLVTIDSTITTLRLEDDEGKTTARVAVDESRWRGRWLPTVVEVLPVRGYDRAAAEVAELLAAQVVLEPTGDDPLDAALAAAGFVPGSYSSKLRLHLDPDATALEAWAGVLRALLATMLANEAGVRDDLDSEFLHDYRVAVRRTRSVLGQARGVVSTEILDRFRPEFAWLGAATGPTRDFDVYQLTMPEFEAGLPPSRRADLKPFRAFLAHEQRTSHAALVAALESQRYAGFLDAWRAWLADPLSEAWPRAEKADDPARAIAAARIWRAYRRLAKAGREIEAGSPGEALHELRKDAKRLRYLLECFGSLFPADGVSPIVKELKGLQDVLGEFQDCEVQAGSLDTFAARMLDAGEAPASTLLAMGYLVEQLDDRRRAAHSQFAERFARFDAKPVRRAARELFAPPSPPAGVVADISEVPLA